MAQGVPGRLRPRIFLTFRHYKGGRSSAKRTGRLYPRRNPWYSLSEAESTSGHMVLSGVPRKKSPLTPPGIDPGISRLVAQCLNHYAIYIYIYICIYPNHVVENKRWMYIRSLCLVFVWIVFVSDVIRCLITQDKYWYQQGTEKLVPRCDKYRSYRWGWTAWKNNVVAVQLNVISSC